MAKTKGKGEETTEVTKAQTQAVAGRHNYGELAGTGFEGTTGDELALAWLNILQSNSPQVEQKTVPGAETGKIINSITNELFAGYGKPGMVVVPVKREHNYVEWVPRDSGGGFVARHEPESDIVAKAKALYKKEHGTSKVFGKLKTDSGNDLVQTFYMYVLILDEEGTNILDFAIVAFNSTKITPYKNWWTAMMKLKGNPPLIANRARLGTFPDKNKKGSYGNFIVAPFRETWEDSLIDPVKEKDLLDKAEEFRDMIEGGAVKVDFAKSSAADAEEGAETGDTPF